MTDKVSIITILNGEKEFIPLIKHNFNNFENNQDYELIIIDDGPENLIDQFIDVGNCIYIHLSEEEIKSFIDKIEEGYKETDKTLLYYQKKCNKLLKFAIKNLYRFDYQKNLEKYHDLVKSI